MKRIVLLPGPWHSATGILEAARRQLDRKMSMRKLFTSKLQSVGPMGAWTRLMLPFDVEKALGSRGRVSVRGTINGFPFCTSIFPNGDGTHDD